MDDKNINFASLDSNFSQVEPVQSESLSTKVSIELRCRILNFKFIRENQGIIITFIIFMLNLINNTDRYVVSSVLNDIEIYFNISKSTAGLLQTIFLLTYMSFSPLTGFLGDRVNRKYMLFIQIADGRI